MKSATDKPVNLERAAGVSGEGWGVKIEQITPEREPLALEILDRLERKTIEAERNRAECLRLTGDLEDARDERTKAEESSLASRDARVKAQKAAQAARAKLALGLEAYDRAGIGTGLTSLLDAVRAAVAELDGATS